MAIKTQTIHDRYAIYCGDAVEVMAKLPSERVHLSVYSPPFCGLFQYSSKDNDLSNCRDYNQFLEHYAFFIKEITRLTVSGRISAVHCTDVPSGNSGTDHRIDLPGDIIRLHQNDGWKYIGRHCVWKEPLGVRNRTMAKNLAHKTIIEDSSLCSMASADYLLLFRKDGDNKIPVAHPVGLVEYAGSRRVPHELLTYRGYEGNQIENRYSQWVWRQYASAFWDDVRIERVLPFRESKDEEDEKHVHPLQLDVIDRIIVLRSNPGEVVLTPFMGVGSEVYSALVSGRRAIGVELKQSYYRQAEKNIAHALSDRKEQHELLLNDNSLENIMTDALS